MNENNPQDLRNLGTLIGSIMALESGQSTKSNDKKKKDWKEKKKVRRKTAKASKKRNRK